MLPARPRFSLLFALALACASLAAPPALASDVQALFEQGNAAFEAEKYEDALAAYKDAWKLTKAHDLAYMMGRTEAELGKLREAAEHYAFALVHFPLTGDQDLRKNVETALADVKKHVATVQIQSSTKDIAITLDGVKLDVSSLDTDLFLMPGKHTVEASAPGHKSSRRPLELKAGDEQPVTMDLTPEGATPRNPLPGYVMGGVGIVGVIIGAALIGAAEGKKGEAMQLHTEIATADNCQSRPEDCQKLRDATAATDGLGNGGVAAMVFGALFTAAGAAYILIPSRSKSSAPPGSPRRKGTLTIVPVAAATTGGLLLSGSF